MLDGRGEFASPDPVEVVELCSRYDTDGLIVLRSAPKGGPYSFVMEFFNPDASTGMMCGNGGRCIVAFASALGEFEGEQCRFLAPDGPHSAKILSREQGRWMVRLEMRPVRAAQPMEACGHKGVFLDTGARHFVTFLEDIETIDIDKAGSEVRHDPLFAPVGTNVDFVRRNEDGSLSVRTFEKGVEGETLACGTGIVASAIAAGQPRTLIHARKDDLEVEFVPGPQGATDVFLTGPVNMEEKC